MLILLCCCLLLLIPRYPAAAPPSPTVARRAIRLAASGAREGGEEDALAALEQLLSDPGPGRQRRAFAEGGISAVLRLLESETARPGLR